MRPRRPLSVGRRLSRVVLVALAALALVCALAAARGLTPMLGAQSTWELRPPLDARRTGSFQHPSLDESSGVAVSRHHPDILWTLNDSGNGPWIFATDTLGRDHGAFRVTGADNQDWEAIALGPCGRRDCLYIADTGDNGGDRESVRLYRVPEPPLPARGPNTSAAEALELRYPGGARDVEAAFVGRNGAVYLISKGRGGAVEAFRVPAEVWRGAEATAEPLGRIPIDTGGFGSLVTDAALSPGGDRVAVRTYLSVFLFDLTSHGTLHPSGAACDAAGLQLQGEGIAWIGDRSLVLTSEGGFGRAGTVVVLEC